MKHEGITLIALVVTIVVLLILAGISIGVVFDDNGIIKKAQEAANKTEEALINEQEALNSLLNEMNSVIDGSGGDEGGDGGETTTGEINEQIVWSTGTATLTLTVTEPTITIQYKKNDDQSWTTYTTPITSLMHGDKVYVKGVKDGQTVIEEKQIDILDTKGPTVTITNTSSTTNSISATATATDDGAGLGSSPNYIFYLKKSMEQDSAYVQLGSGTTASITKGDLEQNTAYTLKVEVSDIAGNKGQATKEISTSKIADAGEGLVNGAIVASSPTWSGGTASTTLSTNTGLTIQYQKNETSGSWSTGTNVTGLHHNDTVFARLTDGKNYGGEASITILDAVNPQDASISLSGTSTNTEGSITATVTLNDNESGVNVTASKWIYNTNSGYIGTSESSYNNNFSSNGQTITLKSTTAGTYYLHVLTVDNAGNKRETISNAVAVEEEQKEIPEGWEKTTESDPNWYDYGTEVNPPKLGEGMTPIVYTAKNTPTTKKWANAITEDGSMWVWIPRYAYSIASEYHKQDTAAGGTINIKFLEGNTNVAYDGAKVWSNESGEGNWNVHPAFKYGQEITGIWVAKFEASPEGATDEATESIYNGTRKKLQIKPGVSSWRGITIGNAYTVCLNYNKTLNSHMMKNDEWGAITYLNKSRYGKNDEVFVNNSDGYITGAAGSETWIPNYR